MRTLTCLTLAGVAKHIILSFLATFHSPAFSQDFLEAGRQSSLGPSRYPKPASQGRFGEPSQTGGRARRGRLRGGDGLD